MSRTTTMKGFALVAVLGLGLTACTSSSSSPSSSGSSSASGGSSSAKTLVIEDNPEPSFSNDFNPLVTTSASSIENTNSLVYEPLFMINSINATEAPIPWLAKSYAWSNGNRTLTLDLQSGVKWSDGKPFTSADVAFTFNLLKKFPAANTGSAPTPSSITTPDVNTVVMTFASAESANFVGIANQLILPQHLWSSIANPVTAVIPAAQAIGTGPFLIDKFGTQDITYKVNPSYWGTKPKVPEISLPAYATNDAATLALASGDIDLTGNDIANVQSVFVAKDPANNHLFQSTAPYYPAGNTVSLLLNNKSPNAPALADVKVRQAISAGVDRASLASQCETNYEAPATSSGGVTLPTDSGALDPSLANDLKSGADTSKVTSLLQSDGYTKSGGKWTKDGKPIKFTIIDPNSFGDYWCDAQAIASGLNSQGFDVTANGGYTGDTWGTAVSNGNFDATLHWGQGSTTFQRLQFILDPSTTAPIGQTAGGDLERYSSPAATTAISAYENATTPAAETAALDSLQQLMSTDVPAVPVLYGAAWYQYSSLNYTGWPTSANPYISPTPNSQGYEYIILHLTPVS
jgi:peptide/nickel transport system substrate-binding protein